MASNARKLRRASLRDAQEQTQEETEQSTNMTSRPKIEITNRRVKGYDVIRVKTTTITIPQDIMNQMKLEEGNFVFTAQFGGVNFLAKRPSGMFGGDRLEMFKGGEDVPSVGLIKVNTQTTKQKVGEFKLGESFVQQEKTEQNQDVAVTFWTLIPVEKS